MLCVLAVLALAVLAPGLGGQARAQTVVCDSDPAPDQRVECVKDQVSATRLKLGADGTWRADGFTLRGTFAADRLASGDTAYAAGIGLRVGF